ncbi:Nucleotidyltransferase domain protein [Sporomusa ovata DSM 2662]|uniref:Predicted nucleotidyltransferases n=1 Tax=Sporomusa ovata TaxID=2378 RepID=A0A0U1L442_9FIRM|nr:nucleotidyltransferase domain-containing protein [Sporomusa ovata]EQB25874.1 putative nucleotidyltransferase [Sporomusa ovata DSM 2662]CQR74448.1 Predicted nucleotidyltransferases [Sporomusa ovata]
MAISADQQQRVTNIMKEIVASMKIIFDENLRQVLLFGSYARGDQEEYSDMDVMVLVNLTDEEVKKYNDAIIDLMSDILLKYGVLPTIIGKNYDHFYHWVPYLPFYRNVRAGGIEYYAS